MGSSSSISLFSALGAFVLTFLFGVFCVDVGFLLSASMMDVSIFSASSGSASGGDYDSTSARFYFFRLRISIFIFIKSFDFS